MPSRKEISSCIDNMIGDDHVPLALVPEYLAKAMLSYPASGGKRLRPALLVWCCEAAGGQAELAWDAALAVELYHNWTLIHDDIIDDDHVRRGRPTCHTILRQEGDAQPAGAPHRRNAFGKSMAILAGDALHGWSVDCVARTVARGVAPDVVFSLIRRMCSWLTPKLIGGEALDVEFELRTTVPPEEIRQMMYLKTGALLQYGAESGVMIGRDVADVTDEMVAHAGQFAALAGVAFQIQDDILGVFADENQLGKPVGSDLSEGKHTLLIAKALQMASPPAKFELANILGCGERFTASCLTQCQQIISECGARKALLEEARETAGRAKEHLDQAFNKSPARDQLEEWLAFLTERNY